MRVLLVNPNQYRTPPVPPLGLEVVAAALGAAGHECRILDLCFSNDTFADIDSAISEFRPDLAGVTVRNIDTVLVPNTTFFLDDIRDVVTAIQKREVPVMAGGAGFSFVPGPILAYIGADWGIAGPGDREVLNAVRRIANGTLPRGTILDGWERGVDPNLRVHHGAVDYSPYLAARGIAGFTTQAGCDERCSYCAEGIGRCSFRNPEAVIQRIAEVVDAGCSTFHLCDNEFNQEMRHSKQVLQELIASGLSINWTGYMKASPWDREMLSLMVKSGLRSLTLSLPTCGIATAAGFIQTADQQGIRVAVDLLVGFPGQTEQGIRDVFDRLRKAGPATVGVNSTLRLLPGLPLTKRVFADPIEKARVFGALDDNPYLLKPVFYRWLEPDRLLELTDNDPLFRVEGGDAASNYERLAERRSEG